MVTVTIRHNVSWALSLTNFRLPGADAPRNLQFADAEEPHTTDFKVFHLTFSLLVKAYFKK